jgi:hypothetical protein
MKTNMGVSCHQLTIALLLGLFAFVATGSPTSAQIMGRVVDVWGNPVAGATVSMPGFRFEAHTDAHGTYKLDYAPGSIRLVVRDAGYVPTLDGGSLALNLATATRVPVQDLRMIKVPPAAGVFIVQKNRDYMAIDPVMVGFGPGAEGSGEVVATITGQPTPIPLDTSISARFVARPDAQHPTAPELRRVLRVQPDGVIQRVSQSQNVHMEAEIISEMEFVPVAAGLEVGNSNLRLTNGLYAVCRWQQQNDVMWPVNCYYFQVGQAVGPAAPKPPKKHAPKPTRRPPSIR